MHDGICLLALILYPNSAKSSELDLALCDPDLNDFTVDIDNPFFPLPVRQV